ncbi:MULTISPECIES: LytTR family DNA-binding domain-containing protein [Streptococcus]|jgi:response regulator of the lytR/algR family|uniref:LytTR family DNA-binding domain-containing protein n=1 Tax=Streptococcus TaxID=1301 RepID=UPI000F65EC25|nr:MULTISPECIES: LytTR family DNA-binding domain-containing protein [Streptococcus]MCF4965071.1 LytTR family transcriptional regulator [Streptococcus sp. GS001]MDB8642879.1 LytTR family DNA-binding domain-containing protein [Streptococcus australis]MDB8645767.1 LytTR family DNA-binding domain-containing protein [Streptococcus australis]MDB8650738.1 LytTR family DNA-binding domain-containing protein [Streptococcus australis]RSK05531.1 putative HTH-type transcriptional regulator [Streptococcus s
MKVRIELDPQMDEPEMIIRAPRLTEDVARLQQLILEQKMTPLTFYKDRSEYFVDVSEILFFETDGEKIYGHTKEEAYEVRQKLYELEEILPIAFCRISKSTIVNTKQIYSIEKSFSGTSTVNFYQTHKQVHVSRHYYQLLKERLKEMR